MSSIWLYSLIVTSLYTCNIIAFLTVDVQVLPFKNLEELSLQEEYTYGVQEDTIYHQKLQVGSISFPSGFHDFICSIS